MLLSSGPTVYDAVTLVSNRMMTRMAQTQLYADSLQAEPRPTPAHPQNRTKDRHFYAYFIIYYYFQKTLLPGHASLPCRPC